MPGQISGAGRGLLGFLPVVREGLPSQTPYFSQADLPGSGSSNEEAQPLGEPGLKGQELRVEQDDGARDGPGDTTEPCWVSDPWLTRDMRVLRPLCSCPPSGMTAQWSLQVLQGPELRAGR